MARFSHLPEEVLEEIMSWLPPESLKRFKCVCKSWYFYISALMNNPEFVAKHLCNTKNKLLSHPCLYFRSLWTISCPELPKDSLEGSYFLTFASSDYCSVNDNIPCVTEDLKFLTSSSFDTNSRVVSHCNGIICCYDCDSYCKDIIILLNPALREFKIVPDADFGDGYEIRGVGFGYDSRANDYKVVTIKSEDPLDPYPYKAELYNLSSNSWKEIELNVEVYCFLMNEYQVVYCNGVCYWYYQDGVCHIVSFDFSDEVFGNIPYPNKAPSLREPAGDDDDPLEKSSKIAVWNDSIALFFYLELDPLLIDMWVMDSCSSGVEGSCPWTRHLTIGPLVGINKPILFWANDVLFMENKDLEIVSYYLRTKKLAARSICKELFSNRVVICEKSLVSVLKKKSRKAQKMQFVGMSMGWVNETKKAKHGEVEQRQTQQTQASTSTAGSFESLLHMVTDEEIVNCKHGLRQSHRKGVGLMIEKSIEPSTSHSSPATYPPQQASIPPFTQQMNLLAEFKKQIAIYQNLTVEHQKLAVEHQKLMVNYRTLEAAVLQYRLLGIDIPAPHPPVFPPLPPLTHPTLPTDDEEDDDNNINSGD